jgi:hypothetical protein
MLGLPSENRLGWAREAAKSRPVKTKKRSSLAHTLIGRRWRLCDRNQDSKAHANTKSEQSSRPDEAHAKPLNAAGGISTLRKPCSSPKALRPTCHTQQALASPRAPGWLSAGATPAEHLTCPHTVEHDAISCCSSATCAITAHLAPIVRIGPRRRILDILHCQSQDNCQSVTRS